MWLEVKSQQDCENCPMCIIRHKMGGGLIDVCVPLQKQVGEGKHPDCPLQTDSEARLKLLARVVKEIEQHENQQ